MGYLTRRIITPEHLDDPNVDPAEQQRALDYLRRMNRRFGGASSTIRALEQLLADWPRDRPARILDVGTGLGDIPQAIARWAKRDQRSIGLVGLDKHPVTLDIASDYLGEQPHIELVRGDARELTNIFEPGSFDVVHSAMTLHHLQDIEVITVLRMMDRIATRGVIWNDLVRGAVSRVLARLDVTAPRMVKEDAIASVRAGFTKREAMDLAARAGLESPRYRTHLLYRFTLIGER